MIYNKFDLKSSPSVNMEINKKIQSPETLYVDCLLNMKFNL